MRRIKNIKVYILKYNYGNGFYLYSDKKELLGIYENITQYLEIKNNQIVKLNSLVEMIEQTESIKMLFNAVLLEE